MISRPIVLTALIPGGASLAGLGGVESLSVRAQAPAAPSPMAEAPPRITVAVVRPRAVTLAESYACRLQAQRHVEVHAPEPGTLEEVAIREGQAVRRGDLLSRIKPLAGRDLPNAEGGDELVPIRAPFDGTIGSLLRQQGGLVREGEVVTTLSDGGVMWAHFKISGARYLGFMADKEAKEVSRVDFQMASGTRYPHPGEITAVVAEFDDRTGTIPLRADFPNPKGLLRHGQSGTLSLGRVKKDAIAVPRPPSGDGRSRREAVRFRRRWGCHRAPARDHRPGRSR